MRRSAIVTQSDVARLIRAAKECGLTVSGVELLPTGEMRVLTSEPASTATSELEKWRLRRGSRSA